MKILFISIFVLLLISIISPSQETSKTVLIIMKDGQELSLNYEDISSLNISLVDSLSWIHIFYKNNNGHFIHSSIGLDSIYFDHLNNYIIVIKDGNSEPHLIDSINYIKVNCEKLIYPHDIYIGNSYFSKPDSVMIDSCKNPSVRLAKKWYFVRFKYYVIDLPEAPDDTTLDVTWESISSTYTNIRSDFKKLEDIFGEYILRKENPEVIDTNHSSSKLFKIYFNNYNEIDSVLNQLSICAGIYDYWYFNRANVGN